MKYDKEEIKFLDMGNIVLEGNSFSEVLFALRRENCIAARRDWTYGENIASYIFIGQHLREDSLLINSNGNDTEWTPTKYDLLSQDWVIFANERLFNKYVKENERSEV